MVLFHFIYSTDKKSFPAKIKISLAGHTQITKSYSFRINNENIKKK